ncbi:MAG: SUMF1/EgtB/PvdO family nonheme iron enzyme [Planctomycetes bacterium]|nr:SUMF1/EgtB/PvdO family nonheme iron enzyme [Planctomycetota bacterium]
MTREAANRKPDSDGNAAPCQLRRGVARQDVVIGVLILVLLGAVLSPAAVMLRERSRMTICESNLRRIGAALHTYHDLHGTLPVAAVWQGPTLRTTMLNEVKQIDLVTYQNWAQLLLPHLDRTEIASQFHPNEPVMAAVNESARMTFLAEYACPTDTFNRADNPYSFQPAKDLDPIAELARGNYGINGGTHNHRFTPETTSQPHFDGLEVVVSSEPRRFELVGTGIAGINHAFSMSDFQNGKSTLVAIEELRAGIHPLDPRGVWALGQIGGSITWAHGVSSDDCGPNNQWDRADDLLGCGILHETVGSDTLEEQQMPCVHYVDRNDQATARSLHANGVNVLFLDGSVRFVHDRVDRTLWHVMHSRETPADRLAEGFEQKLAEFRPPADTPAKSTSAVTATAGTELTNSIEMQFVAIPAGEFSMGIPDVGNSTEPPPECPVHPVSITRAFWLGSFEVTQEQFQNVLGRNPSHHSAERLSLPEANRFPVEMVSWDDANEFCRKLSDLPAEQQAGRSYRLPTEAEWEYACRAGKSEPYAWSSSRKKDDDSGDNCGIQPPLPLKPVGSYRPNPFGLYDMRGSVWEWTADWFDRSYYGRSPVQDPQGPATGYIKVIRGGDWTFVGEPCRINYPMMPPWKCSPYVGFRVVCTGTADR